MYEANLINDNAAYRDVSNSKEKILTKTVCPRRKKRGKQSNPTCIAMRHDKIISSTQIHAVAFSFLSRKPTWAVLSCEWKKGSTGESPKKRRKDRGKKERVRKETCDSTIRAKNHDVSSRTPHAYASRATERERERLFSVRERPTTLYIFISRTLVFDGRKKRKGKDKTRRERAHSISSHHWPGTIDEDFLNDGWVIMWRTSSVLYPQQLRRQCHHSRLNETRRHDESYLDGLLRDRWLLPSFNLRWIAHGRHQAAPRRRIRLDDPRRLVLWMYRITIHRHISSHKREHMAVA